MTPGKGAAPSLSLLLLPLLSACSAFREPSAAERQHLAEPAATWRGRLDHFRGVPGNPRSHR